LWLKEILFIAEYEESWPMRGLMTWRKRSLLFSEEREKRLRNYYLKKLRET